jgi:hypothetical protein
MIMIKPFIVTTMDSNSAIQFWQFMAIDSKIVTAKRVMIDLTTSKGMFHLSPTRWTDSHVLN